MVDIQFIDRPGEELVAELNRIFNEERGTARTLEQWRWEFERAPGGGPHAFVATDDGKVVGFELLVPLRLVHEGRAFLSAKSEDSQIVASHRGQGLYRKIYEVVDAVARERGIEAIWGYTKSYAVYERLGFEADEALESWAFRHRGGGAVGLAARAYHALGAPLARLGLRAVEPRVVPIDGYRDLVDLGYAGSVDLLKDAAFLDWRLASHPYSRHEVYRHPERPDEEIFAVGFSDREKIMEIADLRTEGSLAALGVLAGIIRLHPGYEAIVRTTAGHPPRKALTRSLRRLGFFPVPARGSHFVVKRYDPRLAGLPFAANGLWTEGKVGRHQEAGA